MKERQLIGMVEYVLGKHGDNEYYAKFLNQPLTLGMFVPCDEDGNVYESEPQVLNTFTTGLQKLEYQAAKERVIFEGALINGNELWIDAEKIAVKAFGEWVFRIDSMEGLKGKNLTESTYNKYFK